MAEIRKRHPITAELRSLKPGETLTYPIERYGSVHATICRLRKELMREQWNAKVKENRQQYELLVTRTH